MTISFVTPSARKASTYVNALRRGQYGRPDNDEFFQAWVKAHELHQQSYKERHELLRREQERLVKDIAPELAKFIKVVARPPSIKLDLEIYRAFIPFRRPDETMERWRERLIANSPKSPDERKNEKSSDVVQVENVQRKKGKLPESWHPPMAYPTITVTRHYRVAPAK